jgi:hypothetical protein
MSAVLVPSLEHAQNVNLTKLRELDAFEEFFWLLEQSVPVFHTIIAEVKGATTIGQWERALDAVEVRYPLLSASIRSFRVNALSLRSHPEFPCPCELLL